MRSLALHLALLLALAFGSPVAACCQLGGVWDWSTREADAHRSCCESHGEAPGSGGPCDEPQRCQCRAAADLIAPAPAAALDLDAPLTGFVDLFDVSRCARLCPAASGERRARPPPTLLALHCSLNT